MQLRLVRLFVSAGLLASLLLVACSGEVGTPSAENAPTTTAVLPQALPVPAVQPMVFAIIGDYGMDDRHERDVARLVSSWNPSFIIATGDDYYDPAGGWGTGQYDESTGAYYGKWLKDITTVGKRYPVATATVNAFFPVLGNHDYSDASLGDYLEYFKLPGDGFRNSSGNERYYDFVQGPVHFFALNTNKAEPSGTSATSSQARWLKKNLNASTSRWNIVYGHHPPYSSDSVHEPATWMRWPYAQWGADFVISGHSHVYERISRNGITYMVNGLGGAPRYSFKSATTGSKVRYRSDWGAQKVTVSEAGIKFEFYNIAGKKIDTLQVSAWQ